MYRALVFTNTGGRTCVIQGFPGVSFVAGDDGHQVGAAATGAGATGRPVTLKPGASAAATLGIRNVDAFDPKICRPVAVRGFRLYPPHETKAEFVPFDTRACAGDVSSSLLTVRAVHSGAGLES